MNGAVEDTNLNIGVQVHITSMVSADISSMMEIERISHLEPWSRNAFLEELDRPHSRILVAKLAEGWLSPRDGFQLKVPDSLAGYLCYWLVADEIQILNVSVHTDCRRCGVARRLLLCAFADGLMKGARCAVLEVRKSNAPARALYESMGFEEIGERPDYYGVVAEPAVSMMLGHTGMCALLPSSSGNTISRMGEDGCKRME